MTKIQILPRHFCEISHKEVGRVLKMRIKKAAGRRNPLPFSRLEPGIRRRRRVMFLVLSFLTLSTLLVSPLFI
jgi:hypothetical protein